MNECGMAVPEVISRQPGLWQKPRRNAIKRVPELAAGDVRGRRFKQSGRRRLEYGFRPVIDPQHLQQGGNVEFNRSFGQGEFGSDFLVRKPLRDKAQDIALAWGQARRRQSWGLPPGPGADPSGNVSPTSSSAPFPQILPLSALRQPSLRRSGEGQWCLPPPYQPGIWCHRLILPL